jgi:sugar phosphate isomerase/epimerase
MANKGIEPPLDGYTEEDGFPWVIEAYTTLARTAAQHGVLLGLENHWGLGISAAGVIRIIKAVNSPWLRATLDTGNFLVDHAPQVEALAPYAALVQAKTYDGGGRWYTLEIDNRSVARTVRAAGFRGYVSLEFEGRESPLTALPKNLAMLRDAWR